MPSIELFITAWTRQTEDTASERQHMAKHLKRLEQARAEETKTTKRKGPKNNTASLVCSATALPCGPVMTAPFVQ